ncbi:MAG: AAA family ATPase [Planctomycetota bacterium]|jgi:ATP-dependent Clp protease ATP-binding subunit ClpX|nr:AAA family ATPase [Planctomycetota bacterium]MDP7129002.1 AAA family ATPase [Planctomycetota bacterium]MDP7248884.1 AAA family ATPase [Planctomycetota bacterium]
MPRLQEFEREHDRDVLDAARAFFESLPATTPREIFQVLEDHGYRGQEQARKAVALMAYRHVRRIRRIHLGGVQRRTLPPKNNLLLMGPTGCGKTFLVELLFGEILQLPTVVIDISGFSETGYVGDDVKTILTRLLSAAEENPLAASAGVICLDEFDKLASSQNNARFDGQGTTKDVSGFGVQKELLRILESAYVDVPMDYNNTIYSDRIRIYTGDIAFVGCGAFSGFKNTAATRTGDPTIGFKATADLSERDLIAVDIEDGEANDIENFNCYGFLPELIARFTRLVPLQPLDRETLKLILVDNVVKTFESEFESEGLRLKVEESVLDHIVNRSFERQTGARGLNAILTQTIENCAFEQFGSDEKCEIRLRIRRGKIQAARYRMKARSDG